MEHSFFNHAMILKDLSIGFFTHAPLFPKIPIPKGRLAKPSFPRKSLPVLTVPGSSGRMSCNALPEYEAPLFRQDTTKF